MPHHDHERRFSPDKMARLDAPERREQQPPAVLCEALALRAGTVVADLGVGTGFFALPVADELRRLGGDGKVIGLDVEPRMLAEVGRRAADAGLARWTEFRAVSGDGDLPLPERSVDRVFCVSTVHELDDRPRVWRELGRVLRPGGFALLVDWRRSGPFDAGPPEHDRVASAVIAAELRDAGLDTEELELYPPFYTLRASAPAGDGPRTR